MGLLRNCRRRELQRLPVAREGVKRQSRCMCETNGVARGRAGGDQCGKARGDRFLHHLERAAAGDQAEAGVNRVAAAKHRANQLVQRIVPADVLSDELQFAVRANPGGRMRAAGLPAERLPLAKRGKRERNDLRVHRGGWMNPSRRTRYVIQVFDAAEAAAGVALQSPDPPGGEVAVKVVALQGNVEGDAVVAWQDLNVRNFGGGRDDAFADGEAERKIFQVIWRRHHDGVGKAIVAKRDWRLFRHSDQPLLLLAALSAVRFDGGGDASRWRNVLKRPVHCAVRMMNCKAARAANVPAPYF